jgi:hypothetical protein
MLLDDVIAKIEMDLPGFAWKVGTCSVSDDAWVVPDFNHPMYGKRLKDVLAPNGIRVGSFLDMGVDIDVRPAGDPEKALDMAYDEMILNLKKAGVWDAYCGEFHKERAR